MIDRKCSRQSEKWITNGNWWAHPNRAAQEYRWQLAQSIHTALAMASICMSAVNALAPTRGNVSRGTRATAAAAAGPANAPTVTGGKSTSLHLQQKNSASMAGGAHRSALTSALVAARPVGMFIVIKPQNGSCACIACRVNAQADARTI